MNRFQSAPFTPSTWRGQGGGYSRVGAMRGRSPTKTPSGEDMEDALFDAALGAFDGIPKKRRRDLDTVEHALEKAIRAEARQLWGKKPIVTVFVSAL